MSVETCQWKHAQTKLGRIYIIKIIMESGIIELRSLCCDIKLLARALIYHLNNVSDIFVLRNKMSFRIFNMTDHVTSYLIILVTYFLKIIIK